MSAKTKATLPRTTSKTNPTLKNFFIFQRQHSECYLIV
jgi:hypothetical protein